MGAREGFSHILDEGGTSRILCRCEPVTEAELVYATRHEQVRTLADAFRRVGIAAGPCAGAACILRAAEVVGAERNAPSRQALIVSTSALTGEGIPELKEKILAAAVPARDLGMEGEFITNLRHRQLIQESLASLAKARRAAAERTHHEMLLLDLYDALHALDTLTGATYADDILGVIFSTFCVGK